MNKIQFFLASSNELKAERDQFEIQMYRKCKAWFDRDIFLHLNIWEDLTARMSDTRSQDEYNKKIVESDIFVLLAYNKVGMYTAEEFDKAFGSFKESKKPFIFTYFKETGGETDPSLQQFQDRLKTLNHFYAHYSDFNDLWLQFNQELERLEKANFEKNLHTAKNTADRVINQGRKSVYIEEARDIKLKIQ